MACCWHEMAIYSFNNGEKVTWLGKTYHDHYQVSIKHRYISAVYWSVVTMITLGYGDIIPKNDIEMIFVTFATLFSCIVFAYATNSIGEILKEMGRKKQLFRQ